MYIFQETRKHNAARARQRQSTSCPLKNVDLLTERVINHVYRTGTINSLIHTPRASVAWVWDGEERVEGGEIHCIRIKTWMMAILTCLLSVCYLNHFHLGQRSNVWRYIHQYYHYDHHPTVVGNWHSIDRNVLFRLHRLASRFPSYLLNTLKKLGIVRYRGGRKNGKRIVEDYHHISQPSWTIERCQAIDVVVSQRKKNQEQSWSRCCAWGLNVSEWYRSVWLRKRTSNQHNGTP